MTRNLGLCVASGRCSHHKTERLWDTCLFSCSLDAEAGRDYKMKYRSEMTAICAGVEGEDRSVFAAVRKGA